MRVFISHTSEFGKFPEARSYVAAARQAVEDADQDPVEMKDFFPDRHPSATVCREKIGISNVFVALVGFRYGSTVRGLSGPRKVSYVEYEWQLASKRDIPILILLLDEAAAVPYEFYDAQFHRRQQRLRIKMGGRHHLGRFRTDDELYNLLLNALKELPPPKSPPTESETPGPEPPGGLREWLRRRRWYVAAAAVVTLAILCTAIFFLPPPEPGCERVPTQLVVSTSADTVDILSDLAEKYAAATRADDGCRQANIEVVAVSPDTMKAFTRGWPHADLHQVGPYPTVWMPSSSLDLDRAEAALRDHGITFTRLEAVMSSYLVLAVPDGLARQPGWHDTSALSLAEVIRRAEAGVGTGSLRIVRDGPDSSTEGLVSTAALYRARLGGERLDPPILNEGGVRAQLHRVEQAVVASDVIGEAGHGLGCRAAASAEPASEVALMSEQRIFAHNTEDSPGKSCGEPPRDRLTAFYPSDGVPLLDHPFVLVGGPLWGNPAREAVARDFHAFLLKRDKEDDARKLLEKEGFRPPGGAAFDQVLPVAGIRSERASSIFRLDLEKVEPDALVEAWKSVRRRARVLFAMDVSGSMVVPGDDGVTLLDAAKRAIEPALRLVSGTDQIGLWEFTTKLDGPRDYRELVRLRPAQAEAVRQALTGLRRQDGGTGLFDTIRDGIVALRSGGATDTNNAMVVFTDARNDDPGGIGADQVVGELKRRGAQSVRVIILAFGEANCGQSDLEPLLAGGATCLDVSATGVGKAVERVGAGLWGVD
jgi:Ca-activated chloride channel family protein